MPTRPSMESSAVDRDSPGSSSSLLLLIGLHLLPQLSSDSMQLRDLLRALIDLPSTRLKLLGALIGLPSPSAELPLRCAERRLKLANFRPRSSQRAVACRQLCLFAASGLRIWITRRNDPNHTTQTTSICLQVLTGLPHVSQGALHEPILPCPSPTHMPRQDGKSALGAHWLMEEGAKPDLEILYMATDGPS